MVQPAKPRPSSAAILIRDTHPIQVYLAKRGRNQLFYPGFHSFLGGSIQKEDWEIGKTFAPEMDEELKAEMVALLREIFEETGLLLVTPFPDPKRLYLERKGLLEGKLSLKHILEKLHVQPDPSYWIPLGRKTTPPLFPIRYQTRFFLAKVPPEADIEIWPGELESGAWFTREEALRQWENREILIPPPVVILLQLMDGALDSPEQIEKLRYLDDENLEKEVLLIPFDPLCQLLPLKTDTVPPATHTNCYFIGRKRFYILDPAPSDPKEQEFLLKGIQKRISQGDRPVAILLTHYHRDHVGAALKASQAFEIPIYGHPKTEEMILAKGDKGIPGFRIHRYLKGGEILSEVDMGKMEVHFTPGHSPDHLAYYFPEESLLFCGDLVSTLSSILVPPKPKGSLAEYMKSLHHIAKLEYQWLLPSHGPPTTLGKETVLQFIEHRQQRENQFLKALAEKERTKEELLQIIYGREVPEKMLDFAAYNVP
ncbi:MAG: MBL fold metallo-hydrolase, partial [Planctomycetota bacterium]